MNFERNQMPTKESWFVSDTHFGHANIIKYSNRPFADVQEMNEMLITNWNDCVKDGDDVYFLGDFSYRNKDDALAIRKRLMGTIFFIEGNHDSAAWQIRNQFAWYKEVASIEVFGQKIFLSHYAHRVWNKSHHGVWHLYGHSHNSLPDDPNSMSFDVGVDATANELAGNGSGVTKPNTNKLDYRPISFAEVQDVMAHKNFKPIDHHGRDR